MTVPRPQRGHRLVRQLVSQQVRTELLVPVNSEETVKGEGCSVPPGGKEAPRKVLSTGPAQTALPCEAGGARPGMQQERETGATL